MSSGKYVRRMVSGSRRVPDTGRVPPSTVIARGSCRADQDPQRVAHRRRAARGRGDPALAPVGRVRHGRRSRRLGQGRRRVGGAARQQARLRRLQRPPGEHPTRPDATAPPGGRAHRRDARRRPALGARGGRARQRAGDDRGRRHAFDRTAGGAPGRSQPPGGGPVRRGVGRGRRAVHRSARAVARGRPRACAAPTSPFAARSPCCPPTPPRW